MGREPNPIGPAQPLTRDNFNTLAAIGHKVHNIAGAGGINVQQHPGGIIIQTAQELFVLEEPAQVMLAKNIGTDDLNVFDAAHITEPIQLQDTSGGEAAIDDGTPIDGPHLFTQRIMEVKQPTETSFGRFGICAESLVDGEIGEIWVAGVCLCRLLRTGEWDPRPFQKTADRADTRQDAPQLQLCSVGAAQVLWVFRPLWPNRPRQERLAIIRFDSRDTDGVGMESFMRPINAGTGEVIQFNTATVTRLREAIVQIT